MERNVNLNSDDYGWYKVSMWVGSAILIISSILLIVGETVDYILAISVFIGMLIFLTGFSPYLGVEKPKDERIKKIGTFAATYSGSTTLAFVSTLILSGYFINPDLKGSEILGLTILAMVFSMILTNIILSRKGDIE